MSPLHLVHSTYLVYTIRATRPAGKYLPAFSGLVRGPSGSVKIFPTLKAARAAADRLNIERINPKVTYEAEIG